MKQIRILTTEEYIGFLQRLLESEKRATAATTEAEKLAPEATGNEEDDMMRLARIYDAAGLELARFAAQEAKRYGMTIEETGGLVFQEKFRRGELNFLRSKKK